MMSFTNLQQPDSPRYLGNDRALGLVQAFHQHLEPEQLLGVLWSQAAALVQASGMTYRHVVRGIDVSFGEGPHRAVYTLDYQGSDLGELVFRFQQRVNDATLGCTEDLLALAVPALRNALAYQEARQRAAHAENVEIIATPAVQSHIRNGKAQPGTSSDDALVLVSLDGYPEIRARHGDAWAQTLVQSIHDQIHEGLRDADSVFQIDEGLLAVLLPRTSEAAALDVAGKIRVLISGLHLRDGRLTSQLTACMGVAGARDAARPEDVLERAHAALDRAREEGASSIRAVTT